MNLHLIESGLKGEYFDNVQEELNNSVFNAPIPLVGSQLASMDAGGFAGQVGAALEERFSLPQEQPTKDDVMDALRNALQDEEGNSWIVIPAGGTDIHCDESEAHFQLTLSATFTGQKAALDLALGDDPIIATHVNVDDAVTVDVTWTWTDLTFGVYGNEFRFVTDTTNLTVNVAANLDSEFQDGYGRVGVFVAEIDAGAQPSNFSGTYQIDLEASGSDLVSAKLTGEGEANLAIRGDCLPASLGFDEDQTFNLGVLTNASVGYGFNQADTDIFDATGMNQTKPFGDDPTINFTNIQLDLGTFYNGFIRPVVDNVQEGLKPIRKMVDFLTGRIPLISDLLKRDVTVLTVAKSVTTNQGARAAINTAEEVLNDLKAIFQLECPKDSEPTQTVSLGELEVSAAQIMNSVTGQLERVVKFVSERAEQGVVQGILDSGHEASANFFTHHGARFHFPLLENPTNVFRLLEGDSSPELFTLDASFGFGFTLGQNFPVIPGLLSADLSLNFGANLHMGCGYDAYGIGALTAAADFTSEETLTSSLTANQGLVTEGFYFDDHNPNHVADGTAGDAAEFTLTASLEAGASFGVQLLILEFTFGLDADFTGTISFDLNDLPEPDGHYDGRVRLDELEKIVYVDPLAICNSSGKLEVGLDASVKAVLDLYFVTITLFDEHFEIFRQTLFQFDLYEISDEQLLADYAAGRQHKPPEVGFVKGGTLYLYMGEAGFVVDGEQYNAADRKYTNADRTGPDNKTNERFEIRSLGASEGGGETLEVTFSDNVEGTPEFSHSQTFYNVSRIAARGGSDNDAVIVDRWSDRNPTWSSTATTGMTSWSTPERGTRFWMAASATTPWSAARTTTHCTEVRRGCPGWRGWQ